nr:hypothetical protein [Tanacetum cinerariifolium]
MKRKKVEVVAHMMISRFKSKHQPLVGLFFSLLEKGEQWGGPWSTDTIVDTIAPEFKRIIKDYHIPPSVRKSGWDVTNMLSFTSNGYLTIVYKELSASCLLDLSYGMARPFEVFRFQWFCVCRLVVFGFREFVLRLDLTEGLEALVRFSR